MLPLADSVLATSVDTGDARQDPTDDRVTTPATAACASCHDDKVAKAHMTSNGGSFDTTQQAIDDGEVVEQCTICHGSGKDYDVANYHPVRALPNGARAGELTRRSIQPVPPAYTLPIRQAWQAGAIPLYWRHHEIYRQCTIQS